MAARGRRRKAGESVCWVGGITAADDGGVAVSAVVMGEDARADWGVRRRRRRRRGGTR